MTRKAKPEIVLNHSTGRQAVWAAIRELRSFTRNDLWHNSKVLPRTIQTYLVALERGGYIKAVATKAPKSSVVGNRSSTRFKERVFELVRDIGIDAPRLNRAGAPCTAGLAREQMWRSMKLLGDFTPRDLAVMASTEAAIVSAPDAANYARNLAKAGYLIALTPASRRVEPRYRFVRARDTGPRYPIIQKLETVYDANLCKIMWQEGGGE